MHLKLLLANFSYRALLKRPVEAQFSSVLVIDIRHWLPPLHQARLPGITRRSPYTGAGLNFGVDPLRIHVDRLLRLAAEYLFKLTGLAGGFDCPSRVYQQTLRNIVGRSESRLPLKIHPSADKFDSAAKGWII
jgi:hypothetical protein